MVGTREKGKRGSGMGNTFEAAGGGCQACARGVPAGGYATGIRASLPDARRRIVARRALQQRMSLS